VDDDAFADLFTGNEAYAATEHEVAETGVARRGLAIVTCIDSRIDPLAVLGLAPGDAKILRNAGARVTDDVLRSLALAVAALGVTRVAVVQHTDCKMASASDDELVEAVMDATGRDDLAFDPRAITDQAAVLGADVQLLLDSPLLPDEIVVGGLLLDLRSGRLTTVVAPRTS
jgi:carbonic anhydrase